MENIVTNLTIKTSAQINEIVAALAKAQGEMKPAVFNRVNPHFRNRYADFTSCMEAVREPLSKNGLAISQMPSTTTDGKFVLVTLLAHGSGQWMAGEFPLISAKQDSQGIGSAMTYAKRYSLCGMLGVVADEEVDADDDDGEAAAGRGHQAKPPQAQQQDPAAPAQKVGKAEVVALTNLIQNLDEESNKIFLEWINKSFNAKSIHDIPQSCFEKCMISLNTKIKYINDKNKQQVAVA
jgi:hypothetical protein